MPSFLPLTTLRSRVFLTVTVLISLIAIGLPLYFRVQGAGNPSVVVNKYFNSGTAAGDIVELLVIQNNLDMRGMIVKDFSASMASDGGGKVQFTTNALWSSVPSGTLIVLRNNNSAADTSVGGGDFNLDIGIQNTTYFSSLGGTFDIAGVEMVMVKSAGSGAAGVTGSIHALAGGAAGAQFTATAPPKLIASGGSATNQFVFANNSTQSINDFDGTDATGAATGLVFGAGNNANNTAYINSLRSGSNQAIVPSCPGSINTEQGTPASAGVSATDPDGTVVNATITSAAVPGITLDGFTPAAGVNTAATATLNVANTTAQGDYNVDIQWTNNDSPTPQTATCTVVVHVTPPATPTPTPSPTPTPGSVVISQVYGGGGNVGATLKNDFVELINHTGAPIDLSGWSVQIASAGQANWQRTNLTNFVLQPGQYYLVQQSQGAGGTDNLPTPDAVGGGLVSSTSGKVALVSNQTTLTGNCPVGGGIVDFVGYGTETCAESSPAPVLTNTTANLRKNNGCFDTDNNSIDFATGAPNPRNSSSPTNSCTGLFAVGSAQPSTVQTGNNTTLTVTVSPAQDPTSTGITVTADLSSIGGSATQAFSGVGNTFTFVATIPVSTTPGPKSLPVTVADAQARGTSTTIFLTVQEPHLTISQIYGGGGNAGATFTNDFVELFNPTPNTVDLTGWSLQYTSATGDSWDFTSQPIGGFIEPGQYYLIALAGGATGAPLPAANINGDINMSATTGKVALVNSFDPLEGTCPLGNVTIVDFVGYGSGATCSETANAPAPSNTTAIFRQNGGATDNDNNQADFVAATPNPRRTAPIVELGPFVFRTDPRKNGVNAPRDASITLNFTEPVDVVGSWFNINCAVTGLHNDATFAGADKVWVITPNVNFLAGEQCTFTIFKDQIHDQDTDDSGPNDDTLLADFVATFTVATGTAPPYPPSVHLIFGNPNGATADINQPNNYLMEKPEFTLSYNRDAGAPNWVSWHLSDEWVGTLVRVDTFRPDPAVLPTWYRVQATDFSNSGFDRGHMTPNADRDKETSVPINQATFLMSNMIAQSPDMNQGPWADLENFLRTLLPTNEVYIVAGPHGSGGTGSAGFATTIANGHVAVPSSTWKVILVIPKGDDDVSRVTAATRTIAVNMPNIQGIRNNDWTTYLTTVDSVEQLTGYDFFANVPDAIENAIEAGTNGNNPPGTEGQAVTTDEDNSTSITLTAVSPIPSASFSFTIVTPPAHGALTGTGANRSYQPGPDFNGSDSFTFKANDGAADSNTSTVSITVTEVNDAPTATDDSDSTNEDTNLEITASDLTTNDSTGPANENVQVLTVTSVSATAETHGTVSLLNGTITYSPASNYNGAASFAYEVCDNGTTNGAPDSKCTIGTVNITITEVNNAPTATADSKQTDEDSPLGFPASDLTTNDSAGPPNEASQVLTVTSVSATADTHGSVMLNSGTITYSPDLNYNGPASFEYQVCDNGTTNGSSDPLCSTGTVNITVTPVNDAPVLSSSVAMNLISATNSNLFNVGLSADATDVDGDTVTFQVTVFGDEDDQTATLPGVVHSPDAKDIALGTLRLRGERVETNNGRVYLIVVTATDGHGGVDSDYLTVVVPKNNKPANISAVIAEATAAAAFAESNGGSPPLGYWVIGDGPIIGPKQ